MVETVRHAAFAKPGQRIGHIPERSDANRDDDAARLRLPAIVQTQGKTVLVSLKGDDLGILGRRRVFPLKGKTVFAERVEPDRRVSL